MDQAIGSFLQHLIVEKGFSSNTSQAYRNDLTQFWSFLQERQNGNEAMAADNTTGRRWTWIP